MGASAIGYGGGRLHRAASAHEYHHRGPAGAAGLAGACLLLCSWHQAAYAQADKAAEATARGELVVTAQRREEPILDVPVSVSAYSAEAIEQMGADTVADIARATPNFTIAPDGVLGVGQPAIRGIYSPAGSATVGLYVDDVPIQIRSLGFSGNADLRMFDLERIEVLRGPQGTLFGANSMGGTVRFITRAPELERASGYARLELAATRSGAPSLEAQAAAGAVLAPGRLGLRIGAYYRRDGGHVDRVARGSGALIKQNADDAEATALRFAARAALAETLELLPSLLVQRVRRNDLPFFESSLGRHRQAFVSAQPGEDLVLLPSLTAKIDLGKATLTSVTALLDRRDRQTADYSTIFGELVLGGAVPGLAPEGGTRSLTDVRQRGLTQEIRLASASDAALRWTLGGFHRRGRVRLTQAVVEPGMAELARTYLGASVEAVFGVPLLPGGVSYRGFEHVAETQFSAFGELTLPLSRTLEATAGARLSRSRLRLRVLSEGPYAGGRAADAGIGTQSETPFTPRVGLNYRPAPNALLYMSASKGFRAGGANAPVPADPCSADLASLGLGEAPTSFKSDQLWSYELGAKATLARGRLMVSAAAFQIDWDGIQQLVTLPNCGFSYVDNLGEARSRGFELELDARPTRRLRLAASLGFIDARFRRTLAGGGPATEAALIVARGDRVPMTPRWSLRLVAEQGAPLGSGRRAYARAEFQYRSAYRRAPSRAALGYNPLTYHGEAYGSLQLRAGVDAERWRLSLFVENLTNDRSILFNSADLAPVSGFSLRQTTLRPRTVGLSCSVQL